MTSEPTPSQSESVSNPREPSAVEQSLLSRTWVDCLQAISSAPDVAQAWAKSSVRYVQSTIGSLRLFSSTDADTSRGNPDQDETHYFLIPSPTGYVLAERRRLPPGMGTVNSLPKVRIFHVHDLAGVAILEAELLGSLAKEKLQKPGFENDIATRLETIGEEIDRQSFWVTGGLIMVGGAVAIANPLLGIGIAAKALLPEIGSKLTKFGLGAAADSVRRMGKSWRERSARKEAHSEVKRLAPQINIDSVLVFFDTLVALGHNADPALQEVERLPHWWRSRDQRLTMSVVCSVLESTNPWPLWLETVRNQLQTLPPE